MKFIIYLMSLMFSSVVMATETAPAETTSAEPPAATTEATAPAETSATTEPTEKAAPEGTEQAGLSRGSVVRSVFTTSIKDREPVDKLNDSATDTGQVFYFTELRDMSGQTAVHRWEYGGKVIAEVKFNVRGPRWRVWSSKSFIPSWAGEWKVSVINGAGETISEEMISMTNIPAQADESATATETATEAPAAAPAAPESTEQPADAPSVLNNP